jgi:hypothetical protein
MLTKVDRQDPQKRHFDVTIRHLRPTHAAALGGYRFGKSFRIIDEKTE